MLRSSVVVLAVAAWLPASASAQTLVLEEPFFLGDKTRPDQPGELGTLTAERPAETGHPQPRVIVDASGSKRSDDIQRAARSALWGPIVACYAREAFRLADLKIDTTLSVRVQNGTVTKVSGEAAKKGKASPLGAAQGRVEKCLQAATKGIKMPKGKKTFAKLRIRVFPGDEPVPPPKDQIVRGAGQLDLAKAKQTAASKQQGFEDCYRASLSYAPALWGALWLSLRIAEDGSTSQVAEVGGRFPEERVARCIAGQLRQLTFEKPAGGDVRIVIPLSLKP